MRVKVLIYSISVWIACFLLSCTSETSQSNVDNKEVKRPNVIILMTDDQGYGELSVHGNPILQTPQLDKLHDQSIRFTDFHVEPMCTPTRGQLMTGLDAVVNGAVNVSSGRSLMRRNVKTIANYFSDNGYKTGIFGKWHLGDNYPFRPEDRGFDETLWFPSSHISSVPDYWGNDYFDDVYTKNGKRETFKGFCTDVFFQNAKEWMKKCFDQGQPFFTYLPTNAPHQPFFAKEEDIAEMKEVVENSQWSSMPARKRHDFIRYLAMIRNIDWNVGELMKFMDDEGLTDNTIFIFLTDNGSTFGPDYYNAGMRGKKTQLYEGGHRVPFFIRWPKGKGFDQPRDIDGLTQVQDIVPTLMDLCEISYAEGSFSGQSLASVLAGDKTIDEDRTLFVNFSEMPFMFDYPSPYSNTIMKESGAAVLWKNWRLLRDSELYDLENDPLQKKNIIDEHPEIVSSLMSKRAKWWSGVEDIANKPVRIIIGNEHENPLLLSSCDWMDVFVDQQGQVKQGERKNSYWLLEVEQEGLYEFELRRWPKEYDIPLNEASINETALPIGVAKIFITGENADFRRRVEVKNEDTKVVFQTILKPGTITLHTWFDASNGEAITGAYYVYVTRK
ncbi:arylsulfatase [Sunxiuqinia sp. A32]|uniref:arylsulfatase n=1 Tax=Sunxiuqinia sp. A32 TaxID=3461496 RepID=UPI0040464464